VVQIVKLGGSAITRKGEDPEIRRDVLERLADELEPHADEVVLVHGAGSFGHPIADAHDLDHGVEADQVAPLSEVHQQVRELNLAVLDTVRSRAGPCLALSPFGLLSCNDGMPGGWNLVPVHRTLELGTIPILYGDVVLDTQRGVSVLSGDRIAVELARFLEAERVIFALDEEGAYSHPPSQDEAELLEEPGLGDVRRARDRARKAGPDDATGGMAGKLDCTLAIARDGTQVHLVDGTHEGRVRHALRGDGPGTRVDPEGQP
jgi:isopentenyl phosphate kinase